MDTAALFSCAFLSALVAATALKLWLAGRHMRCVAVHRGLVPAAFAHRIRLPEHQKAADYTLAKIRLGMAQGVFAALVLCALTLGGGVEAFAQPVDRWLYDGVAQDALLVAGTLVMVAVLHSPFGAYRVFGIDARFGFNRMTPAMYVLDLLKHAVVFALFVVPLLGLVLWLMRNAGTPWWMYAWGVWLAFNVLLMAIYPGWIAPLFNRFTPLSDKKLRTRIEKLMQNCGFSAAGLFVMDGSRRSTHSNAYFTGFGKTKRIVLYDTLLSQLESDEVEAVLAHELGHFKLHHVLKQFIFMALLSLAAMGLLAWLIQQPWFYAGLNAGAPDAALGLLLFILVGPVFGFFLLPMANHFSRRHEFEADRYAARHADASGLIRALTKLYKDNAATLTPDPLHSAFYDTHPPAALRIARLQQQN
ncbi:MAG: M48 family metallopeptidase [Burkholderiales bacterium]